MSVETQKQEPTNDEEILLRAFRACTPANQEHLFWLCLTLSKRELAVKQKGQLYLLADPLRKFR